MAVQAKSFRLGVPVQLEKEFVSFDFRPPGKYLRKLFAESGSQSKLERCC